MPSAASARPGQCGEARQREAQRDQPEADRQREVGDPGRDAFAVIVLPAARSLLTSAMPPSARIVAIIAPMAPATMCATAPIRPLRQELAGRERQQLAFARRDRRPEHAEPERQGRRERGRSRDRRAEELARDDLGERQQHDPAERQAREAVLGLDRECLYRHG